jgi:hypothetical protein
MQHPGSDDTGRLYPCDAPSRTVKAHQRRPRSDKSLPKGITFDSDRLRYRAVVTIEGRQYHGGWFNNVADAVSARNALAVQLYGSDARLVPPRALSGLRQWR